ncbi:MAG: type II toxin-antitoxin system RelE/ParE family toxin [Raoultibacter sp.]
MGKVNMHAAVFSSCAQRDLESLVIYIGEVLGSPQSARRIHDALLEAIETLRQLPNLGKPFYDERLTRNDYRSFLVENYRIFYSFNETTVTIKRILHTRQDSDTYALISLPD